MRDYVVIAIVVSSLPFIIWRPYIGVLVWCWLSFMNPHRLTFGPAFTMPFAQIVGIATLVGLVVSREPKRLRWSATLGVWLFLVFWMTVTTFTAEYGDTAQESWEKMIKIQTMAFLTVVLIHTKDRLMALVWVITLSIGFYGIKGGIFTILTGGANRVWGPEGSFIEDNNEMALALIMVLPLMRFLQMHAKNKWVRHAMLASMVLTAVAIIGSHSRGALLASVATALVLWLKSRRKVAIGISMIALAFAVVSFMPDHWTGRMQTIQTYDEDASAMGRINAWKFAINLANARPLVGGGFGAYQFRLFARYAPDPEDFHDAHSIYFEVLAEHGYVGILSFLLLGFLSIRTSGRIAARYRKDPDRVWAVDLASMTQVGLIGFAVGGAFLGLAYFDLYYALIGVVLIADDVTRREDTAGAMAAIESARDDESPDGPNHAPVPAVQPVPGSSARVTVS